MKLLQYLTMGFCCLGFLNSFGQEANKIRDPRFNVIADVGLSYLFQWDQSYLKSSSLTPIDSRIVGTVGIGGKWNILKKASFKPVVGINVNMFRSKASNIEPSNLTSTVEFRNTFISYLWDLGVASKLGIGKNQYNIRLGGYLTRQFYIIPYTKTSDGMEFRGFDSVHVSGTMDYRPGGPYYKGPVNIGVCLSIMKQVGKINLGVSYYQRCYFYGVNREISRLSLRVGF